MMIGYTTARGTHDLVVRTKDGAARIHVRGMPEEIIVPEGGEVIITVSVVGQGAVPPLNLAMERTKQ